MKVLEETDDRFYIKQSTIYNAGRGLFAKNKLKRGDCLEIIGVIVKNESIADDCTAYADNYKFSVFPGETRFKTVPMGFAAIINHTENVTDRNVEIESVTGSYVSRSPFATGVVYRFARDIDKDEELLTNYGDLYNKKLSWIVRSEANLNKVKDDWDTFLEFDLYDLGRLKSI